MILYQALSSYQILECMVHRKRFHKQEETVLLLGTYITERMPQYEELQTRGFFDHVYLFRYGGYLGKEEQILREVEEEFSKTVPIPPDAFRIRYAAGIHTYLQVLWAKKELPFIMFEDGSGALSRPWILSDIHKKSSPARWNLVERYHLYDHTSPWIMKKICDLSSQEEGFHDEKAEDFPVMENFEKLLPAEQQEIRELFRLPCYTGCGQKTLILTQQFANLGQLTFPEQIVIYQNLMDYYLQDQEVIIKPHPDDILYYGRLFPQAVVMKETFPAELLPMAFSDLPKDICTISSTGINLIRNYFSRTLVFQPEYEKTFRFNHLYYMALSTACRLGFSSIWAVGLCLDQLRNMAEWIPEFQGKFQIHDRKEELPDPVFCFVDTGGTVEETETIMNTQDPVLFFNTDKKYRMYSYERKGQFLSMIPLVAEKRRIAGKEYWDTESTDVMYLHTTQERIINMSRQLKECRDLHNTGTRVTLETENDLQMRVRMLEGILEATERRLLEYIQSEKDLKKQLERYQRKEQEHRI